MALSLPPLNAIRAFEAAGRTGSYVAAARELEAMAWLNIRLQFVTNGYWQSSFGLVGAPEAALA